jgi:TolB-like protein/DNA-binding winged helix-turn-helix (wHTH) protein/tetratricopeptide (TPR) repeat protein
VRVRPGRELSTPSKISVQAIDRERDRHGASGETRVAKPVLVHGLRVGDFARISVILLSVIGATTQPKRLFERARATEATQLYRFGVFELDPHTTELRREGRRVKLQKKSFQLLLILLNRAGDVVPREELRGGLWPEGTFVDFDANIKTALNKLRQSLGDSAENPVFIETIPKIGFKFLAPVTFVERSHTTPLAEAAETGIIPEKRFPSLTGGFFSVRRWSRGTPAVSGVVVVVLMAFGLLALWRFFPVKRSYPKPVVLLVLPFDNLSGDPGQQFFSDGVTDEMITLLGATAPPGISVIARTSVMQYRTRHKSVPEIVRELGGADYVLEGSVRRAGDQVGINVALSRATDQGVLWADTYQRKVGDLLMVQQDVAERVSHSLLRKLTAAPPMSPSHQVNSRAHDTYLMGLYYQEEATKGDVIRSIDLFRQATRYDPNYAPPYAALAYSYMLAAGWELVSPAEAYPQARAASEHALQLDQNLAEAHMTLATADHEYYWKWTEAETEFRRAISLNPNSSLAHLGYAEFLLHADRNDEAVSELERALDLDPLLLGIRLVKGLVYLNGKKYDSAAQEGKTIIQADPQFAPAYYLLGGVYEAQGRLTEAIAQFQLATALSHNSPKMSAALARAYALSGRRQEAHELLVKLERQAEHSYVSPYSMSTVYAGLGDIDRAFELLRTALTEHSSDLMFIRHDPGFANLREDLRFKQLVREIGFPTEWSGTRN